MQDEIRDKTSKKANIKLISREFKILAGKQLKAKNCRELKEKVKRDSIKIVARNSRDR
jgi:hypothetical protein